jgi:hypothetical protein
MTVAVKVEAAKPTAAWVSGNRGFFPNARLQRLRGSMK